MGAPPSHLLDREQELEEIDAALASALTGVGRVLLVNGAPGIGKSRLVEEVCVRAQGRLTVLRGRGGELERGIPLLVARELFGPVLGDARAPRFFRGAAGLARRVLTDTTGGGGVGAATLDMAYAVAHGLYWLTANVAEERPLALVVDDAHWTDEATQRWLAHLLPRVPEMPVLVVLAARPRELDPAGPLAQGLARQPSLVLLRPSGFREESVDWLVRSTLGEADAEFVSAVGQATGGNPLLVTTLLAAARAQGLAPTSANAHRVEALGTDWLAAVVLPRLHVLGSGAVRLARAAAVLGEGCTTAEAAAVAGSEPDEVDRVVEDLVRADLLRPDRTLGFTHPLVRAAVLDELTATSRATLHRRAATVLAGRAVAPERIAEHLLECDALDQGWAVETLRAAAAVASERGAPATATRYLVRALSEPVPDEDRATVLLELGWAAFRSADGKARDWFEEALAAARDPRTWVLCWLGLGNLIAVRDLDVGGDLVRSTKPALEPHLERAIASSLLLDYGFTGRVHEFHPSVGQFRGDLPAGDAPFDRMYLAAAAMRICMEGGPAGLSADVAARSWRDGALLAEAPDFPQAAWAVLTMLESGRPDVALEWADAAVADAARRGSRAGYLMWNLVRACAHLRAGHVADAHHDVQVMLEAEDVDLAGTLAMGREAVHLELLRERGSREEVERWLERGAPRPPRRENVFWAWTLQSRGFLLLDLGRLDAAAAAFEGSARLLTSWRAGDSLLMRWRDGLARTWHGQGLAERAVALAEEELAAATRSGAAHRVGAALATLGTVRGGAEGTAMLQDAAATLESTGGTVATGRALLDLGRQLRHGREPAQARTPLRRALDIAEHCGATTLAALAHEELLATGAKPRRRQVTGVAALTPSERRVVLLAADGLSNPEIAQALFVTRKTVEKHLANAFPKLGVATRGDLRQVLKG